MSTNQLVELATAMVDAFVQGGKVKPVLPEGRREDIVSTLAWLIANTWQGDDEALDAYIAALEAEQEKQGVREPLLASQAWRSLTSRSRRSRGMASMACATTSLPTSPSRRRHSSRLTIASLTRRRSGSGCSTRCGRSERPAERRISRRISESVNCSADCLACTG